MGHKVQLAVYDLSMGMARTMSQGLLGMQIEGIWHTGVVVYGKEHFFGGGVVSVPHEQFLASYHMTPVEMIDMGETEIPEEIFDDFLREIGPRFTTETYDLIRHNCNNFSNEAMLFLVGEGIPERILNLPEQVFSTPMGVMLRPMLESMQGQMQGAIPGFESYGTAPPTSLPPLVPPSMMPPMGTNQIQNPWASMNLAPVPAPASVNPAPAPRPPAPPKDVRPPGPSLLETNNKPLLSIDPPAVLAKSLETISAKLRAVSSSSSPPLLSGEEDAVLTETTTALATTKRIPHAGLSLVYTILTRWPSKAEFAALSLLRPIMTQAWIYQKDDAASNGDITFQSMVRLIRDKLASPSDSAFQSKAAQVMALCALNNAWAQPLGAKLMVESASGDMLDAILRTVKDERPDLRQMASAFLANLALSLEAPPAPSEDLPDVVVQLLCGSLEAVTEDRDSTSSFRRLLVTARLVKKFGKPVAELLSSLGFVDTIRGTSLTRVGDVKTLALEILADVSELQEAQQA